MAKKKSRTKIIIPSIIAGILVVLYVTTGFPFQFIPFDDAQGLLDDILNAPPDSFEVPVNCTIASECDGEFVDQPPPITDIVFDCDIIPIPATELFVQECPNVVLDPIDNMTKVVGDDGTVQDPIVPTPEPVSPPEPEPELFDVSIISTIFKTDNNGTTTESTTNFEIPLLAFFVEDTSNIDFDNGFIQQGLVVSAPPNTPISLIADFDILIANQTILPEPLTISINGITDQNGELSIDYVNPLGLTSKDFLFSFADHLDKFPTIGTENVEFVIDNVKVTSGDFEFALQSVVIYSIAVATDPNQIIITDEAGGRTRVFPTDDSLRIYSTPATVYVASTCQVRRFCSPAYTYCCYPAPAMGGGKVTHIMPDGTEEVIASFDSNGLLTCKAVFKRPLSCSSSTKVNILIQRNEIYKIDFTSPTFASITFKTPMEQKNYVFYCKGTKSGIGTCNFLSATFQQQLADTLVN